MDAVRLLVVFILIIIALRKRIPIGVALFVAGLLTAILFRTNPAVIIDVYWRVVKSERFISLTLVVVLITVLGSFLKELKYLERLTDACRSLYGGQRTAVMLLPSLVGLMPMPAGSLLSAPLVDNVLTDEKYRPEFKTTANYWFRHMVELFWPIYPGIILTEAITGFPIGKVSLLQFPLFLGMMVIGLFFFTRKIEKSSEKKGGLLIPVSGIARSIWPILLAIGIYAVLKTNLAMAILISMVILMIVSRPKKNQILTALKTGFSYKLIFLIFGVLSLQAFLEESGAIELITNLSMDANLPSEIIIFVVCFVIGILTGMVSAYVGLGYTLLAGMLYQPDLNTAHIMLAYLSGFLGVILSPSHLCLVLTNEYFKSELVRVYRKMIIPLVLFTLIGFLIYLSPWPGLF